MIEIESRELADIPVLQLILSGKKIPRYRARFFITAYFVQSGV